MEEIYPYLTGATWFFQLSWVVLLLVACVVAFRSNAP